MHLRSYQYLKNWKNDVDLVPFYGMVYEETWRLRVILYTSCFCYVRLTHICASARLTSRYVLDFSIKRGASGQIGFRRFANASRMRWNCANFAGSGLCRQSAPVHRDIGGGMLHRESVHLTNGMAKIWKNTFWKWNIKDNPLPALKCFPD